MVSARLFARGAVLAVLVQTLSAATLHAQPVFSDPKTAEVVFAPGGPQRDGFETASIDVVYRFGDCYNINMQYHVRPKSLRHNQEYWLHGQRLTVPQSMTVKQPTSVPFSGRTQGGLVREFALTAGSSGGPCAMAFTVGKASDLWEAKATTAQRQFALNAIVVATAAAGFSAPPLRDAEVERVLQAQLDALKAARTASDSKTTSLAANGAPATRRPVDANSSARPQTATPRTADQRAADSMHNDFEEQNRKRREGMFGSSSAADTGSLTQAVRQAGGVIGSIMEQRRLQKEREERRRAQDEERRRADSVKAAERERLGAIVSAGKEAQARGDYAEAMRQYRLAADQGSLPGRTSAGLLYYHGYGVPQSYAEALDWIRPAAEGGFFEAQRLLGQFYLNGNGVASDTARGMEWLARAAEHADPQAEYLAGALWFYGLNVPLDTARGLIELENASAHGFAAASYALGAIYLRGNQGVRPDSAKGLAYLGKACDGGGGDGCTFLGTIYEVQRSPEALAKAASFYRRGTELGFPAAFYNLGRLYLEGLGVPADKKEALEWFRRGAEKGDENSKEMLRRIGG